MRSTEIRVTAVPTRPNNGFASVRMPIDVFVAPFFVFVVDELDDFPIPNF